MKLGAFSVSLTVKEIQKSKDFYLTLGFKEIGGNAEQGWLILRNDSSTIGLFQGMFDKNMLTYNPGWEQDCSEQKDFTDIRDIQKHLEANGVDIVQSVAEDSTGPGHMTIADPDGNLIFLDQHV